MAIKIRLLTRSDWPAVKRIYEEGISTGQSTFTQVAPEEWDLWLDGKIPECCLVAFRDDNCVGWASLERISRRTVYAGVAVVNIYIAEAARGAGVGSALLAALIDSSEAQGIWTLEARIFPENESSIKLHKKLRFREVGLRRKLGRMEFGPLQGTWRDVLLLERRSTRVGLS